MRAIRPYAPRAFTSKIRFQHHAITGFTVTHMLDSFVDFRHRIQFGGGRHFSASGKLHQFAQFERRTGC